MKDTVIRIVRLIVTMVILAALVCGCSGDYFMSQPGDAQGGIDYENDPNISHQSKSVIRVGVFRGEDYYYWNDELKSMGKHLYRNGLITNYQARNYPNMDETWEALCGSTGLSVRGRLEFVPEYLFTYSEMSRSELQDMLALQDIDLMITFGTVSGKYMTAHADEISYDYMVFGGTSTIASGIIKSETERFNDKSFAQIDVGETRRGLQAGYDIFRFEDVGVVYQNDPEAYLYSGIDVLEDMSEEYGFTIHREFVNESYGPEDDERFYRELKAAYDRLQPDIDALYITTSTMEPEMVPELIGDMIDAGIVTIAQESEEYCRAGALMHMLVADAEEDGEFMATTIGDYCNGTPITELDMVYVAEPRLFLNYETIVKTGVKLPMEAYLVADTIYTAEGDE